MDSTHNGGIAQQRGRGALRVLLLVVVLGVAGGVGYLLLSDGAAVPGMELFRAPAAGVTPTVTPAEPDPVLSVEELQRVQPAEQVESPPDGRDQPPAKEVTALPPKARPAVTVAPLPSLNESDTPFRRALLALDTTELLTDLLVDEELIRKFVVVVDNMAEGRIPRKHSIVQLPKTKFRATESNGSIWLDGFNFGRYDAYVTLLVALDNEKLTHLYQRYYPLMQQAYGELGYPRRSFHQRLLEALDELLDSPIVPRAIALEQPSVMYKFVDPELEQLSDVHKQLLRLGPANAEKVLNRATLLRTALGKLKL